MSTYRLRAGLSLILLLGLALAAAAAIAEDLRIDRTRSWQILDGEGVEHSSRESTEVVFIGAVAARFDAGPESFIVRADDGVFFWLDHPTRSYAEQTLPLRFENLLTEDERECIRQASLTLPELEASVAWTADRRVIEGLGSTRLRIEGRSQDGMLFEGNFWITQDLPTDLEPYHLLVRNRGALSLVTRSWIAQLVEAGGYSVESVSRLSFLNRTIVQKLQLEAVSQVDADATRYRPPAGYVRKHERPPIDFHCSAAGSAPSARP